MARVGEILDMAQPAVGSARTGVGALIDSILIQPPEGDIFGGDWSIGMQRSSDEAIAALEADMQRPPAQAGGPLLPGFTPLRPRDDRFSYLDHATLGQEAGAPDQGEAAQTARHLGRMAVQTVGTAGGIALGTAGGVFVGGPPGGVAGAIGGGATGSALSGQLYDAALDWALGTQERAPILSGQTALDVGAGAFGPIASAAARPVFRALSGVTRPAAERVEGAIVGAIERTMRAFPRAQVTQAEINAANAEASRAAAQAYQEAMASGMTAEAAEAAAKQAGTRAAQEAARGVWAEAEAAGTVPPKAAGKPRRAADFPQVQANAVTAADLAGEAARLRTLRTSQIASPEAAANAARDRVLNETMAGWQSSQRAAAEGMERAGIEAGNRAASNMARRLTPSQGANIGSLVAGYAAGDVTGAGVAFLGLQGLRMAQRYMARSFLQDPSIRQFVLARGLSFGTPGQAAISFGALAGDNTLMEGHREAARELERAILAGDRAARQSANKQIQANPDNHFIRMSGPGRNGNASVPMLWDRRTNRPLRRASESDMATLGWQGGR